MATEEQINDELFKLRRQGREDLMKLMGVDIPRLRAYEKEMIKKYSKLETEMQTIYEKSGEETAKRHKASQTRAQKIIQKNIENQLSAHRRFQDLEFYRYLCPCYFPYTAEAENSGEEIILTPSSGATSAGSVIFDDGTNISHPVASAHSQTAGEWSGARVKAWFSFSFTPESDGTYCILPVVHINGYWMLWFPSTGCENFESLPVYELRATVGVRVDQLSSTVQQISHAALAGPNYITFSSGFDYDSEVNQEIMMEVPLTGGDQAVVFVECELQVGANNLGHAKIDMQSSPHFHFEVPLVRWGYPCVPFWSIQRP